MTVEANAPEAMVEKLDAVTELTKKAIEKYEATGRELIELKSSVAKARDGRRRHQREDRRSGTQAGHGRRSRGRSQVSGGVFRQEPRSTAVRHRQGRGRLSTASRPRTSCATSMWILHESPESFVYNHEDLLSSKALHSAMNKMMRSHSLSEFMEKRASAHRPGKEGHLDRYDRAGLHASADVGHPQGLQHHLRVDR